MGNASIHAGPRISPVPGAELNLHWQEYDLRGPDGMGAEEVDQRFARGW